MVELRVFLRVFVLLVVDIIKFRVDVFEVFCIVRPRHRLTVNTVWSFVVQSFVESSQNAAQVICLEFDRCSAGIRLMPLQFLSRYRFTSKLSLNIPKHASVMATCSMFCPRKYGYIRSLLIELYSFEYSPFSVCR